MTHIGDDWDRKLAAAVSGIDAIVGGDSHTFLYRPAVVRSPSGAQVPIAQDGEFGVNVGRLDLTLRRLDGLWRVASWRGRLIPVGARMGADRSVAAALRPYLRPFEVVVGTLPRVGRTPSERMRATTQVLVDAMRQETGATVAANPAGGGLFDPFPKRRVTRYDLYAALPFHNNVVRVQMTGRQVRQLAASRRDTVLSGDMARLSDDTPYTVAMVDFVAAGEYRLPAPMVADTTRDVRLVVADWLRRQMRPVPRRPAPAATRRLRAGRRSRAHHRTPFTP